MTRTVEQLLAELTELEAKAASGHNVHGERADVDEQLAQRGYVNKNTRGGSRFAGPGASPDVVKHLAASGSIGKDGQFLHAQPVNPHTGGNVGTPGPKGGSLAGVIRQATEGKALAESTPSAGGVLVPEQAK